MTRFKLELALLGDDPEVEAVKRDVYEMAGMLETYLAFARGDLGDQPAPTDMAAMLEELKINTERHGHRATVAFHGQPEVTVRPRRSGAVWPTSFPARRGLHRPSRSPAIAIIAASS